MLVQAGLIPRGFPVGYGRQSEFEGAEYGVAGPTDNRFQIRAQQVRPSTRLFPFNTICFLEADLGDGRFLPWCSGTLIAPRVILTARHCLINIPDYFLDRYRPCTPQAVTFPAISRIRVSPGADLSAPPALQRSARPTSIVAPGRSLLVDSNLDFGIIILPRAFTSPSRFMVLQPRNDLNTATLLTIAGYPCDKPNGTMWGHSERIPLTGITPTHLTYTIDTCPGHSGSPIWLLGNNDIRLLLGVHTGGVNNCQNDPSRRRCQPTGAPVTPSVSVHNCGVRITCSVIDDILRWCRNARVQGPLVDRNAYQLNCGRRLA